MVSFLNVNLPVLLQVNRSEGGTLLPWPNGSLLSGKLMPPTEGSDAMLMLGNYRVRVEVPPNTPMGHVWMQLVQREMPGQFRLLTAKQAEAMLAEMLQQKQGKQESPATNSAQKHAQKPMMEHQEWAKIPSDTIPFSMEAHGNRLMLWDEKKGQPQGMLQKEEKQGAFCLSGRLDLEHLGGVAFSIEEKAKDDWGIQLHFSTSTSKFEVEQGFGKWLEEQEKKRIPKLTASLFDVMPSSFGQEFSRDG